MNHNNIGQSRAAIARKHWAEIQPATGNATYFFNSLLVVG